MMQSDQREHVLMGSSAEDARLVAEAQTPAQQAAPVGVTIVVVMDDPGETQSHVTEERRVLHHVRVR